MMHVQEESSAPLNYDLTLDTLQPLFVIHQVTHQVTVARHNELGVEVIIP